jgi:hypothetical protein
MEFHDLRLGITSNPITDNIFIRASNDATGQPGDSLSILTESGIEIDTEDGISIITEG